MMENEGSVPSISKLDGIKKDARESENFAGNAYHNHEHSLCQTASRPR
jgi:hypothetical protein